VNVNYLIRHRHDINVNRAKHGRAILSAVLLVAVLGAKTVAAEPPRPCDVRLSVELTPDVPNPRDLGFLSSLLSNHPGYELTLRLESNNSVIVLELTGPGPDDRCRNVIETMRRDGRVLTVDVQQESS
jgi:hypothetical protein